VQSGEILQSGRLPYRLRSRFFDDRLPHGDSSRPQDAWRRAADPTNMISVDQQEGGLAGRSVQRKECPLLFRLHFQILGRYLRNHCENPSQLTEITQIRAKHRRA
jgi:hypothetical protein